MVKTGKSGMAASHRQHHGDVPPPATPTPVTRCSWAGPAEIYVRYHDEEWGVPEYGNQALFERLILEGMQAGLSWLTVLQKRERMQERFFGFDVDRLARASERSLTSWLKDSGIIRHRGKLEAMVGNARAVRQLDTDLSTALWQFVDHQPQVNSPLSSADVPSTTPVATAMAKWLKQHGFRFVGPTTCYAFMQSAGLVNDHLQSCFRLQPCLELGRAHPSAGVGTGSSEIPGDRTR